MLANRPPLSLFQVQTLGGVYSGVSVMRFKLRMSALDVAELNGFFQPLMRAPPSRQEEIEDKPEGLPGEYALQRGNAHAAQDEDAGCDAQQRRYPPERHAERARPVRFPSAQGH